MFAPIGIAAKHLSYQGDGSDNYLDGGLVTGLINTIGGKLDAGQLKRAAENKPSGIVGALTGGKKEYERLRAYLQNPANAEEKARVLNGQITNVNQLQGYGGGNTGNTGLNLPNLNIAGTDVVAEMIRIKKREEIKKMLPFIIIGVVLIIFVTFLIAKNAKSK